MPGKTIWRNLVLKSGLRTGFFQHKLNLQAIKKKKLMLFQNVEEKCKLTSSKGQKNVFIPLKFYIGITNIRHKNPGA